MYVRKPPLSLVCSSCDRLSGIDVDGVHQHEIIAQLGNRYDIHTLVQADITTTEQRTKLDVFDDALFLVCKLIFRDLSRTGHTVIEQICFYLKDNVLITFQETPKDLFDSIKSNVDHVMPVSPLVFALALKIAFGKAKVGSESPRSITSSTRSWTSSSITTWTCWTPWARKSNRSTIS